MRCPSTTPNNVCKEPTLTTLSYMVHDKRWPEKLELEVETVFDDEGATGAADRDREEVDEFLEPEWLLKDLLVGQSISFFWEDDEVYVQVEDAYICPVCGAALTEARLAFLDPGRSSCPACGRIPMA